jgi:putative ABC transport system permease protein
MLIYNIKTALRNLSRLKSHTVIGLTGLAIGFACVFIISAWAIQELSYDRFHSDSELIYMVTTEMKTNNGDIVSIAETSSALAPELKNKISSIEQSFHFVYLYGKREIKTDISSFEETGIAAEAKILGVFNFPLLMGSAENLEQPNSILISENLAQKLFPNDSPIGKTVKYNKDKILTVKGILKNIPENSSIKFDFIVSYQTEMGNNLTWSQLSDATFIKLTPNADIAKTKQIINSIWRENFKHEQFSLGLTPITKLRYGANFEAFNAEHGNSLRLYSFMGIALLILILASLNYANLTSAYAIKRTDEVGIRKIYGANFNHILKKFLIEALIYSIIVSITAVILCELFIHHFEFLLDVNISSKYLKITYIAGAVVSLLIVGITSGLSPAIITSSFLQGLKNRSKNPSLYQSKLKNAFILSQFILSITLTISCLIIIRQTNYLRNFDVGYNPKNIVQVYMPPEGVKNFETIRNNLLSDPNIEQVSFSRLSCVNLSSFFTTDKWKWEGVKEGSSPSITQLDIDYAYLDVFQIPLLEGRNFSASKTNEGKVIVNEKLSNLMDTGNPIGKILWQGENKFEIIGVVNDFHFQKLSNSIQPLLFTYSDTQNRMYVKIARNTNQGIDTIKKQFVQFYNQPFDFVLVEDSLNNLYANENKISLGIIVFSILSIILSCIGLIGLVAFNIELKMKEIGLRKVCGAKITDIIVLLNKEIIKWFVFGFIISCVLSWYLMSKWLENFAFKTPLSWWIFLLGAIIVFLIITLALTRLSLKAGKTNPVDSIKYE